jgi:lycopene cyclase domain-containing protein
MKVEYLLLNILILIGPLSLSFDRKVHYFRYWPKVFISIAIVFFPFLIWDIAVTGVHWHFNENYTLPFRFWGLPLGELMFFVTVPFACLFIFQIMRTDRQIIWIKNNIFLSVVTGFACLASIVFLLWGKHYTAIVCFALAFTIFFDRLIKTQLLSQKRTYLFLAILTGLIFVFNGYLTARPVVLYEPKYFTDVRIWTIPIEDFGYGYTLILLCTILFEKFKGLFNA